MGSSQEAIGEDSPKLEEAVEYDYEETATSTSTCGCLLGIWCPWRRPDGYVLYEEEHGQGVKHENGLKHKLKKVKVLSQVLGGPKWKNFIRYRFRIMANKKRRVQFQYDLRSYSLNFDDGTEKQGDAVYVGFSARYADPLGINRGNS